MRWWVTLVILLATETAHAQSIAIEVYVGDPPAESGHWMAPVLDVLADRGVAVGADGVGAVIEERISRPGRTGDVDLKQLLQVLDEGTKLYRKGDFKSANEKFEPTLATLLKNPWLVVGDDSIRESIFTAELNWARSLSRAGEQHRAREVMAGLAGAYPDRPITEHDYGPAAEALYLEATSGLRQGRLAIRVDDPDVDIYLDGHLFGTGGGTKNVLEGLHSVYVQKGTRIGRLHPVDVKAEDDATTDVDITWLDIEWMFDACLYTSSSGGVGFRYASREERDQWMVKHLVRLGELMSAPKVTAFRPGEIDDVPALIGTTYTVETGEPWRNSFVEVTTDPSVEELTDLATYLAGDRPSDELNLLDPIPPEYRKKPPAGSSGGTIESVSATVVSAGAVFALGAGLYWLKINEQCSDEGPLSCQSIHQTKREGIVAVSVGVVASSAAGYLWGRSRRGDGRLLHGMWPWITGGVSAGAVVFGGALIALHDPVFVVGEDGGLDRTPTYRPTLVPGAILATVGALGLGLSIYSVMGSSDANAVTPTLSVADEGAVLGVAGRF